MTDKTTNTPLDFKKFRDKVKARLREIGNPKLSAAFAARMAMAALPMLADRAEEQGFLRYWNEEDREKHLLAVCRALQICWSLPIDFAIISRAANAAANAAAAAADAAAAAADAAYAACAADAYAAAYADAAYADAADAAADAAANAANADNNLIPWIEQKLASLSRTRDIGGYLSDGFPPLPLQAVFLSHLRQTPSFDYWADWLQDRYNGKPVDPDVLKKSVLLPEEIAAQDPRAINRYLQGLAGGKREAKIKRVRAIFIGNGEAGKTSLIQALDGKEVVGDTAMTCGIAISEWKVPGTDLRAHFWDFGGQVIAHATHQFFLRERCVYVLVLNARSTDSNPNQQAEYWLEFVRAFGNDAPVLLVGNKCDLTPVQLDTHRLRERYPNIRDFHGLAATEYRGKFEREFGIFRDAFIAELTGAGEAARLYFSREEFAVIEDLREESRKSAFLEKSAFEGVCQGHGIGEGERRWDFLNLLDQLGEVIHFPALSRAGFREFLLNPRWLTHGVYRLLYSETLKDAQGVLRWNDVRAILRGTSIEDELGNVLDYPEEKLDFLVRAMTEFKLCYPAPDRKDTWIVPDLLPSDQPARIDFDRRGALSFDFRFETFLPRHVLGMFMVEHYRDIHDNRAWQHGVHLASRNWQGTQALVRADYQARILSLAVAGPHVDRYFSVLYDSIYKILERMPKLKYTEHRYSNEKAHLLSVRRLLARGDYLAAWNGLHQIPKENRETWREIETEFGFAFDFRLDKEADAERRKKFLRQIEWRRKVFAVLETDVLSGETKALGEEKSDVKKDDVREQADVGADVEKPAKALETKPGKGLLPEQQGEKLERDSLRLLRQLFDFDEEAEVEKLRQQKRGMQFGFDIKLEVCFAANNRNVRCLVECKGQEKTIVLKDVADKLLAAEDHLDIDHWILIAPRAVLSNELEKKADKWSAVPKWPFEVQFWTADRDVGFFFGLAPDIYSDWTTDYPSDTDHPKNWNPEERKKIRQRWLAKLKPPLRLPKAWANYVTDPRQTGLFMESDDRDNLRELWQDNRYIPPGALDESGSPLPGGLEKVIRDWLAEGPRVGIVLGEFGDGKSAFTYMLARGLLTGFRDDPAGGWLPLRLPLRYFSRPNASVREFLRNRLEGLDSSIHEWEQEVVEKRNVLVILDGMDEMTKSLTFEAVRQVVELLVDCCNLELKQVSKILITCRRTFFEELAQRPYVEGKLDRPMIAWIEPFGRKQVYEKLETLAMPEQRSRLTSLRSMHDPLGLARKPLFFKMVSETLADSDADFSSETAIYRGYVESCLRRKTEFLETDRQNRTDDEIIAGVLDVMQWIAMEMHLSDRDYVCLRNPTNGDNGERGAFAKRLWEGMEEDTDKETDAVHRVGVRSLLSRATGKVDEKDTEAWPVEFCHRSVREYFVARGIETALREGLDGAKEVIAEVDINHEVLRFTAELMRTRTKEAGHDYERVLRDLARLSQMDDHKIFSGWERDCRCRLGRTAVTLLFKWSGKLEAEDWSRMLLDGAQLAGTDLSGKDFHGTSLRHANLNNAILDDADFRFADLTEARLGEAGEMTALSVPYSSDADGFFVTYRDGSIRRWSLDERSDFHPEVIFRFEDSMGKRNGPLEIAALPGRGLCVWDRDSVWFLDPEDKGDGYREISRFSMENQYPAIAIAERNMVVPDGERTDTGRKVRLFDFSPEGLPSACGFSLNSAIACAALDDSALVGALADGRVVVQVHIDTEEGEIRTTGLNDDTPMHEPTCITAYRPDDASGEFLVACGNRGGLVAAWGFTLEESGKIRDIRMLFCREVHRGTVKTLGFVDGESLLTGDADGGIHRLALPDGQDRHPAFELKLRCRGTKVAGLKSEREKRILEEAGAASEE